MKTLLVEKVEPYSPGDECASVTLRSEQGVIEVFCWPCDLKAGDIIENRLSALVEELQAAYCIDWPEDKKAECSRERLEKIGHYAYKGCATALDVEQGLISVLGFCIDVGEVPFDEALEFEFSRVSLHP